MWECEERDEKLAAVTQCFTPVLGKRLRSFETAQGLFEADDGGENQWDDWFDLPIRLHFGSEDVVSLAWSHFDRLWMTRDRSLNFQPGGTDVRWQLNAIPELLGAIGGVLEAVELGRGDVREEGRDAEIWTRVMLRLDTGWLEIFNGLDENAFAFHVARPEGRFLTCCRT